MPVTDAVLQDSVKQRRPLFPGAIRVIARQLDHRILHDIERLFPVAHGDLRHTQRTPLHLGQKLVELSLLLQRPGPCRSLSRPRYRKSADAGGHPSVLPFTGSRPIIPVVLLTTEHAHLTCHT